MSVEPEEVTELSNQNQAERLWLGFIFLLLKIWSYSKVVTEFSTALLDFRHLISTSGGLTIFHRKVMEGRTKTFFCFVRQHNQMKNEFSKRFSQLIVFRLVKTTNLQAGTVPLNY